MEDKRNEMITITVYADDTGLFTEEECDLDNTVDIEVPRWILEEWYDIYKIECKAQTAEWTGILEEEVTFDDWINEGCSCDDFIGFYNFCIIKGYVPNIFGSEYTTPYVILYDDDNGDSQVLFEGTYDECRRWGRLHGWEDLYLQLKSY